MTETTAIPPVKDEFYRGIWWRPHPEGGWRNATPGECAAEIQRLRATLAEVRRDIEECADDVVWMRGGIETVCDRITAVLGDADVRNE